MDYLSPEMVTRKPHDHRVDSWALGVLLCEMLTGQPPFAGRNASTCIEKILNASFALPASVPEGAQDLARSLLKVEASERLPLPAALHWPWVQDMLTDPVATDEEMPILVEPVECASAVPPLNIQVPATMHLQPFPKCASQRSSPRAPPASRDEQSGPRHPSSDVPRPSAEKAGSTSSSNSSMSFFGSALRPYHADWPLPSARGEVSEESSMPPSGDSLKEGAFLLRTCLLPAAGLCQRQPQSQAQDLDGHGLQAKLEALSKPKARRKLIPALEIGSAVRLRAQASASSASSRLGSDSADADASTDIEADLPSLPNSGSIRAEGTPGFARPGR